MSDNRIPHFLLTRFNVPFGVRRNGDGIKDEWFTHRLELFSKYCLPSVHRQTFSDFHWLLMMDSRTPGVMRKRLECKLAGLDKRTTLIYVHRYTEDHFLEAMKACLPESTHTVLSTRFDNDDAIAPGYLRLVQESAAEEAIRSSDNAVIDCVTGCQLKKGIYYQINSRLNPFLSFLSVGPVMRSAFHLQHLEMSRAARVVSLQPKQIQWIQVVHDRNIRNRVRSAVRIPDSAVAHFCIQAKESCERQTGHPESALDLLSEVDRRGAIP